MPKCHPGIAGDRGKTRAGDHSALEVLGQLQSLALVIRLEVGAVERFRPGRHALVDKAPDDLAVLDDEGHIAGTDFEHGPGALAAGRAMTEAGIEETPESVRQNVFSDPTISTNPRRSWPGLRSRGFLRVQ